MNLPATISGCDFITTTDEAASLVKAVDNPGFGLHFDTGGILLLGEDLISLGEKYASQIKRLHISAPNLDPIYQYEKELKLAKLLPRLRDGGSEGVASIEMKKSSELPSSLHITQSIEMLQRALT